MSKDKLLRLLASIDDGNGRKVEKQLLFPSHWTVPESQPWAATKGAKGYTGGDKPYLTLLSSEASSEFHVNLQVTAEVFTAPSIEHPWRRSSECAGMVVGQLSIGGEAVSDSSRQGKGVGQFAVMAISVGQECIGRRTPEAESVWEVFRPAKSYARIVTVAGESLSTRRHGQGHEGGDGWYPDGLIDQGDFASDSKIRPTLEGLGSPGRGGLLQGETIAAETEFDAFCNAYAHQRTPICEGVLSDTASLC